MNFYLIEKQVVQWTMPTADSKRSFPFKTSDLSGDSWNNAPGSDAARMHQTFLTQFNRKFKTESEQHWIVMALEFSLNAYQRLNRKTIPECNVKLEGELLQDLQQMMFHGNPTKALNLRVILECTANLCTQSEYQWELEGQFGLQLEEMGGKVVLAVAELRPQTESDHLIYVQENVPVKQEVAVDMYEFGYRWTISVLVTGAEFIWLEDLPLSSMLATNRKIFMDRKYCDFELVSEDGTAIPCHKSFLSASSPVLCQMLEADFVEAKQNKMELKHMSTAGVNALLAFIYCQDVYSAMTSSTVAFQLLQCADMYEMPELWKVAAAILLQKKHDSYSKEVALALHDFIGRCDHRENAELNKRMVQVLAMKRDEL